MHSLFRDSALAIIPSTTSIFPFPLNHPHLLTNMLLQYNIIEKKKKKTEERPLLLPHPSRAIIQFPYYNYMVICTLHAVATSLSPNLYNPLHLGIHPYTESTFIKVTRKFHLSICKDQFLLLVRILMLVIAQQHLTYIPLAPRPPCPPGFSSFLSDHPTSTCQLECTQSSAHSPTFSSDIHP